MILLPLTLQSARRKRVKLGKFSPELLAILPWLPENRSLRGLLPPLEFSLPCLVIGLECRQQESSSAVVPD